MASALTAGLPGVPGADWCSAWAPSIPTNPVTNKTQTPVRLSPVGGEGIVWLRHEQRDISDTGPAWRRDWWYSRIRTTVEKLGHLLPNLFTIVLGREMLFHVMIYSFHFCWMTFSIFILPTIKGRDEISRKVCLDPWPRLNMAEWTSDVISMPSRNPVKMSILYKRQAVTAISLITYSPPQ